MVVVDLAIAGLMVASGFVLMVYTLSAYPAGAAWWTDTRDTIVIFTALPPRGDISQRRTSAPGIDLISRASNKAGMLLGGAPGRCKPPDPHRCTVVSAPSGNGRCNPRASDHGACIHISISSGAVRITGMAFG